MGHMTIFLVSLALALLAVGAIQAWAFVFRYRRENWRKYEAGRLMMVSTRTLALVLSATLLGQLWPTMPMWLAAVISAVLFGAVDYSLYRQHRLLTTAKSERVTPEQ